MADKPKRSTFRNRLEEMIATLRNDILTGKLQPGDFLPSELTLVEQFQLSKNSVRKGLEVLLDQDIIEKVPRIGTRVIGSGLTEKLKLKFGYYPTLILEANLLQLIEDFQASFPHIEVEMIPVSDSFFSPHPKEAMNKDAFDLITINTHHYGFCLDNEAITDMLAPLKPQEGTYPFLLRPFTENNNLFVQPFTFSPIVLCYNKEHFKQAKLPEPDSSWIWSDVQKAALALTQKNDRMGLFFHLQSINRWPLFLLQNKVVFERDAAGKLILDNDNFRESMQMSLNLLEGMNAGSLYMSENDSDSEMYFLQQKASMIVTSYYSLNHLRRANFDYDIAPLPYSQEARTQLIIIGLAISKASKQQEAAQALLNYLVSEETQLRIRKDTLSIPSIKAMAEWTGKESLVHPSRFMMYRDIIPTFRFYSDMNVTFHELETMRRIFKLYWARLDDFDSVLRKLEEAL